MKTCNKCRQLKPMDQYHPRKDAPDGLDYRCRECEAARRSEYRQRNIEKERLRENQYAADRRAKEPEVVNDAVREWRRKYPERSRDLTARRRRQFPEMQLAHEAARKLHRAGYQAHHWSYKAEHRTDVIHLTRKEHRQLHAIMVYDQPSMRFRRRHDGLLLDSKESHLVLLKEAGITHFAPHFELD